MRYSERRAPVADDLIRRSGELIPAIVGCELRNAGTVQMLPPVSHLNPTTRSCGGVLSILSLPQPRIRGLMSDPAVAGPPKHRKQKTRALVRPFHPAA